MMFKQVKKIVLSSLFLAGSLVSVAATAELAGQGVFEKIGASTTSNPPQSVDQAMMGGSFSVRFDRPSLRFAHMTPPRMQAGCNGIDLYGGSFSFVELDQFVENLQNMAGGQVAGYMFKLAMDSLCSDCMKIMNELSATVEDMNRMLSNQCAIYDALQATMPTSKAANTLSGPAVETMNGWADELSKLRANDKWKQVRDAGLIAAIAGIADNHSYKGTEEACEFLAQPLSLSLNDCRALLFSMVGGIQMDPSAESEGDSTTPKMIKIAAKFDAQEIISKYNEEEEAFQLEVHDCNLNASTGLNDCYSSGSTRTITIQPLKYFMAEELLPPNVQEIQAFTAADSGSINLTGDMDRVFYRLYATFYSKQMYATEFDLAWLRAMPLSLRLGARYYFGKNEPANVVVAFETAAKAMSKVVLATAMKIAFTKYKSYLVEYKEIPEGTDIKDFIANIDRNLLQLTDLLQAEDQAGIEDAVNKVMATDFLGANR